MSCRNIRFGVCRALLITGIELGQTMKSKLKHGVATERAYQAWQVPALMLLLTVCAVAAPIHPVATSAHPKLSKDVNVSHPNQLIDVIVQYRVVPRAEHYSRMTSRGATVHAKLTVIRAAAFRLPASAIAELEKDPDVLYVTPDRGVKMSGNEDFRPAVQQDVAAQQYGFDGSGVGVAVIDSGVADHKDFHNSTGTRVVFSQSFVPGVTSAVDTYGHGTHVSGIIAGNGSASGSGSGYSKQIAGMAPNANIIDLRVLDQNGAGTDSQVIAAIQRAITLKTQYNIRVINLSLGRPVFESYTLDPLDQAVEAAWKAGIVVVVAAGNSGRDNSNGTNGFATIGAPGNDPAVITVGATRTSLTPGRADDEIASYSSKGPTLIDHIAKPDLVAPGNRIISLIVKGSTLDTNYPSMEVAPTSTCTGTCATSYFRLSGTSMATPVVSGAAALMLQKDSTLTPDTVKARLMKTAWKAFSTYTSSFDTYNNQYNNQYDLFTYGAGYLDVDAALASNDVANGLALSPTAVYNSSTGTVSLVNTSLGTTSVLWGSSIIWGTSVLWGNSIIWGSSVLQANSVLWGSSIIWGTSADQGFSIIWGSSIIWGASTTDAAFSDGQDGEN
jgi:serine protease AprX